MLGFFAELCCKLYSMPHPSLVCKSQERQRSPCPTAPDIPGAEPQVAWCQLLSFACRFPIQLPSASHQIRGCLQHHVQPGRSTATAQQWLLVQGGVHAPKHSPFGTTPPMQQLCPGISSALPVLQADLLTVIPEQCQSVSPATPSFSVCFFKVLHLNNSFIIRVLSSTSPLCSTRHESDLSCIYNVFNMKPGFVLL